jgi:(R,R)-butanediol dehydrogenase/meso-butanediol dehydrogenase/diacetyl reductase
MKAALWYAKKDVRVMDVPEPPKPKPGWVKVKVAWCGICGSDLHEYVAGPIFIPTEEHPLTHRKSPLILGHEFSGKIVEVGEGVKNFKVGDRVAPDACQHCGECYYCVRQEYHMCVKLAFTGLMTDGAFAEYVNVPAELLYVLPDGVSDEAGALIEPISVGVHAVRKAPVKVGDTVVILGAGTIGLVTLQAARVAGAGRVYVIEVAKARKEMAAKAGATAVLDPTEIDVVARIKELTGGLGADVAIECIGNKKTAPLAIQLIRKQGTAVMVGIFEEASELNFFEITATEKHVVGSLAYNGDFASTIEFLNDGRIDARPLITGRIKLADIVSKGFEELVNHKEQNIKIIVSPN